jgi:hypothetical protein
VRSFPLLYFISKSYILNCGPDSQSLGRKFPLRWAPWAPWKTTRIFDRRRIPEGGPTAVERSHTTMPHTRAEVIKRATLEFKRLDRLVARLTPAEWRQRVPRAETKDPWTVKDSLAHITHWKAGVALSARGQRRPAEERGLNITDGNRLVYARWRRRSARDVLAWHRQVQADLLAALQEAPSEWFSRPSRGGDWPFDLDGHSAEHRVKDIQRALAKRKTKAR